MTKAKFNRSWSAAGILGAMVVFIIASDDFSGLTAQALSAACSSPSFTMPASFPTGDYSAFVAVGDFNNDGKQDLVVANSYFQANDVSLLLGDGTGSFGAPKHFPVGGFEPNFIVAGDFNGDHNLDFAVTTTFYNTLQPGAVIVRLGDGKGDFAPAISSPAGIAPTTLTTGDFNNDGRLDLVVGSEGYTIISEAPLEIFPGGFTILLGNGTGGFTKSQSFDSQDYAAPSIAVGDFNGDGNLDLAVGLVARAFTTGVIPRISILLGNGAGTFTSSQDIAMTTVPSCVLLGDFNRDGKLDLVNVDNSFTQQSTTITIRLGNGAGTFGSGTGVPVAPTPTFAVAGDFNLDGNLDLVVANGRVWVMFGDGSGGFGSPTETVHFFNKLATGDFNNDGLLDLAVMQVPYAFDVSILLNTCGAPTTTPGPKLLAFEQSNTAAALDSLTMVRDPFPFIPTADFSSDHRTRIILFAMNIDLQPGENAASVTVHAENSQHAIFSVPAEFVGRVTKFAWLSQVNVRLPDELSNGGDVSMSVVYHGVESNKIVITIKPAS